MKKYIGGILVLLSCFVLNTCKADVNGANPAKQTIPVKVISATGASSTFNAELARTKSEHAKGLSFRSSLKPDGAMLFIFRIEGIHNFWMKNTFIPLDMIFIGRDKQILGCVKNARPQDETPVTVNEPTSYVLEVNAGVCEKLGISGKGAKVQFSLPPPK